MHQRENDSVAINDTIICRLSLSLPFTSSTVFLAALFDFYNIKGTGYNSANSSVPKIDLYSALNNAMVAMRQAITHHKQDVSVVNTIPGLTCGEVESQQLGSQVRHANKPRGPQLPLLSTHPHTPGGTDHY